MMNRQVARMAKSPLFDAIRPEELEKLTGCLGAEFRRYTKDGMIWLAGEQIRQMGIVIGGSAMVYQEEVDGRRSIITRLRPHDLFGEGILCAGIPVSPMTVEASENCEVCFLDFHKVIATCGSACGFHRRVIENLLMILGRRNLYLTQRMALLSKKTIREKILLYLAQERAQQGGSRIVLPFNREEMADYLGVYRSALSRELSHLQSQGKLVYQKNKFTLFF